MKITFLGHSSFMIESQGKHIYINPIPFEGNLPHADLVLISGFESISGFRAEYYHPGGIEQVRGDDTKFISVREVCGLVDNCRVLGEMEDKDIGWVRVRAIPAYHKNKPSMRSLGFYLHLEGKTLYYTGLTDAVEEIKDAKADILIVCVGGRYMMNANAAAEFTKKVNPKLAIPSHYGKLGGHNDSAELYKELLEEDIQVRILEEGASVEA